MSSGMDQVRRLFKEKKINEAVNLLKDLAEQNNDAEAQFNLASLYMVGVGVNKDISAGLQWMEKASQQGHAKANYCMGQAYLKGDGVEKNIEFARRFFGKAAEGGLEEAKRILETIKSATFSISSIL